MSAEARILDSAGRVLAHGTSTMMVLGKSEERTPAAAK
jgi:acyl-coenzyme A thioesterase PaaI-like protein